MTIPTLETLIELCRNIKMTPEQATQQRRSFAYGNCKIENDDITREIVDAADERVRRSALGQ